MESLFCSPQVSDDEETHHFLEKILREDCVTWVEMMTKSSDKSDDDDKETKKKMGDAYDLAKAFLDKAEHMKALETTEKTISDHGTNKLCSPHHHLQGDIFFELARKTDSTDMKCVYLFASVDSYSTSTLLCLDAVSSFYGCARSLIELGDQLRINKFYEKAVSKAKRGLSIKMLQPQETCQDLETEPFQALINLATEKMSSNAALTVYDTGIMALTVSDMTNQMESGKKEEGKRGLLVDQLNNFWATLHEKTKREFLVVDSRKLIEFIQNKYGKEVKGYFRKCICVDELRWRCWKCHICAQVNYCFTDCKRHILDNHVHKFVPQSGARPKCVDQALATMICCGNWEPVDTEAIANLIKGKTERGEEFVYVNGWCSDWPVAKKDEERRNKLRHLAQDLKSSNENGTLSRALWDLLIDYTEENLQLPQVPGSYLDKCNFFNNPQCICFLDLKHLEYILKYFRELTTDVCRTLVSTLVKRLWENSLVKERIDLDRVTLNLLLDERLLYEGEHHFDEIETVRTFESSGIYEHVIPKGDKIVSWILDCPEIDEKLMSQMAKGVHNLEIWIAALRIVRCTARKERNYYDKRNKLLTYGKILQEAETLCDREDNRKNDNQRSRYALMLRMKCEERVKQDDATNKCFFNVVRDVFEGAESPRLEVVEDKVYMECISRLSASVENVAVKEGLLRLRNSLKEKLLLIDSKIFMKEYTYNVLGNFPKLSAIENRIVVLPFVKKFLRGKLKKMMKKQKRQTSIGAEASAERVHKKARH